jgi:hypothetical protein
MKDKTWRFADDADHLELELVNDELLLQRLKVPREDLRWRRTPPRASMVAWEG